MLSQIRHEDPEEFYDRSVLIYKSGGNEGVYRTYSIPDGKPHILKVTSETMEQGLENDLILKSETLLSMRVNSEFVMKPKEIFYFNKRFVIITKEMDYGSLDQILEHCNEYTEEFVKYTIYMVARGIKDLHEHQILHRDIKTNNVLSNSLGEIKITDLG